MRIYKTAAMAVAKLEERGFKAIWHDRELDWVGFGDADDLPGGGEWRELSIRELCEIVNA